jgi:hypothetical protein
MGVHLVKPRLEPELALLNRLITMGSGTVAVSPEKSQELLEARPHLVSCLRLLALEQQTWGSLSGIYESLKRETRPLHWRQLTVLGVSEAELARFRLAVSSRRGGISGLMAKLNTALRRRSGMSTAEARQVLERMVGAWVRILHDSHDPIPSLPSRDPLAPVDNRPGEDPPS